MLSIQGRNDSVQKYYELSRSNEQELIDTSVGNSMLYRYCSILIPRSCFLTLFRLRMSYNTEMVCDIAAAILLHSVKGTRTRKTIELAGFKIEDTGSKKHHKFVERKRERDCEWNVTHCQ